VTEDETHIGRFTVEFWTVELPWIVFARPPFLNAINPLMGHEKVHCLTNTLINGKFGPPIPKVVGDVTPSGEIENTDYKFHRRVVIGGQAVTMNSTLKTDGDDLINPATGERFRPTKSGKGYFSKSTGTFVKPYLKSSDEQE
jgi:hypothetical protein